MTAGLLIFDLDGTLMDTRRDLAAGINLMRRHYGLPPLPVNIVAGYVGNGIHNLVRRALRDHPASRRRCAATGPVDLEEAVRINYRFYRAHIHDHTALYPGVAQGLRRLRAGGYALAVISNKKAGACRELLRHFRMDRLFAAVLGGDSVRELKPHPEAVRAALRKLRAAPARTWMIGDHVTDLEAARRAGVRSAFVSYGIGTTGKERPAKTFASFAALTRFFLKQSFLSTVRKSRP